MKKLIFVIALLLVCSSLIHAQKTLSPKMPEKSERKYPINDAHCHFVDFVQNTDGIDSLLHMMDRADVENIALFGISVTKQWTDYDRERPIYYDDNDAPVYYYAFTDVILAEAIHSLTPDQQKRIYPMICGFNPADRNGIDHIRRMMDMYPGLWKGIGEVFFRHDDLTRMTYGRNPTANCITMDSVYIFAAENNLPVWIHSDIGDPISNKPTFLYEMKEALTKHKNTTMVWCHIGDTRQVDVAGLKDTTINLLERHDNLYYDLSWVVFDQIIAPKGKVDTAWVSVFEKYSDRFMIGTDEIGHFAKYDSTIRRYDVLLDTLSEETAKRLASENFLKLLQKE